MNRDLSKIIIVDNIAGNFYRQKDNGICIRSWYGDNNDTALVYLEKMMIELHETGFEDVRTFLKQQMVDNISTGLLLPK